MQPESAPRECGWPQGKDALGDIPGTDSETKMVALLPSQSTLISLHPLPLIRNCPGTSEKHRKKSIYIYICITYIIYTHIYSYLHMSVSHMQKQKHSQYHLRKRFQGGKKPKYIYHISKMYQ